MEPYRALYWKNPKLDLRRYRIPGIEVESAQDPYIELQAITNTSFKGSTQASFQGSTQASYYWDYAFL